jgi:hypothetical protein
MAGKAVPYDENRHDNARRDMEENAVPQTLPYESLEGVLLPSLDSTEAQPFLSRNKPEFLEECAIAMSYPIQVIM